MSSRLYQLFLFRAASAAVAGRRRDGAQEVPASANNLAAKVKEEQALRSPLPRLSRQILELAPTRGEITVKEIEESTGANRNTIKVHLRNLASDSYLAQVGKGRGAGYTLKWLRTPGTVVCMIPTAQVGDGGSYPRGLGPNIRFAWFPAWLRKKENFRSVATRDIDHIYKVRPRYAVVSFNIYSPFSSAAQCVL